MCPTHQIPSLARLSTVIEIIHTADRQERNEPIDLYRLHDTFTTSDEPDDDVADENYNVGWDFGYGRPDIRDYDFENDEVRDAFERYLNDFWPVQRRFNVEEGERVCDGEDGDGEEQGVGGDGDGEGARTDTDATTTAVDVAAEEEEVSTNDRYTDPATFVAPTPANTPTQRYFRLAAEVEVSIINRHPNTDNPFAPTPANTPTQRSFRWPANNNATPRAAQARND